MDAILTGIIDGGTTGAVLPSDYLRSHDLGVAHPQLDAIRRAFALIDEMQWRDPAEIRECQLKRVDKLVRFAQERVPFYTSKYGNLSEIESWEDFSRLPITSRPDFAACKLSERSATKLPAGHEILFGETTSGTTGDVVVVMRTDFLEQWRNACIVREFDWWQIEPSGSCAIMRFLVSDADARWNHEISARVVSSWVGNYLGMLIGTGPGYHFPVARALSEVGELLPKLEVSYLQASGTYLLSLQDFIGDFRPRGIFTIGENLYEPMRRGIESAYNAPVFDTYATVETNRTAAQCPSGNGYHVHDENVILEILRDDGSACEPGEIGRVVLTSLHNFASPVIRYDIGDLAEAGSPRCACGRGLTHVASFQGRQIGRLRLANGKMRIAVDFIMTTNEIPGIRKFRLTQRGFETFELRMTGRESLSAEEFSRIQTSIERIVERPISLTVIPVEDIPLGPRGKLSKIEFVDE